MAGTLGLDRLDAQLLLLHALGKPDSDRAWLLAHDGDTLAEPSSSAFSQVVLRRAAGEPLAYIVGYKDFYGLRLKVDARVLVPRPDTETLVKWALEVLLAADFASQPRDPLHNSGEAVAVGSGWAARRLFAGNSPAIAKKNNAADRPSPADHRPQGVMQRVPMVPSVLDLGTGSGAIALALAHGLQLAGRAASVLASDASSDALVVASGNAQALGLEVQFLQSSWLNEVSKCFHLIVSNPPYIANADRHLAALSHEPIEALTAGNDGLDDIRQIIENAPTHLESDGWLLLEHGYDQAAKVRDLLLTRGFGQVQSRLDLVGVERCTGGQWLGTLCRGSLG